ncbi:MAG: ZPR1 zinc finger domain-containing protein [Candidatus Nanoarchaeia archaeon]|jgi:zinc finger protein|nr:ZPR1 zinc finger domain-containing protein [Candidatus Nanoarchaeia archaeon]
MTNNDSMPEMEILEGQKCPMCGQNTLTLTEAERDVPFFGEIALFSMDCSNCNYHKADIESLSEREPTKYTIEIDGEEDLKIRVVKSSFATVKIAHVGSIEPGEAANGYVTNIEGILNRMKHQVESIRDNSDESEDVKKAKNILKKLTKVLWGQEKLRITLEDPTGNSAIISDKAEMTKLKKK